jgi:hypothetical protein
LSQRDRTLTFSYESKGDEQLQLNLEPIGLPNVTPSTAQRRRGHFAVGVGFGAAVQVKFKTHPLVSLIAGGCAAFVHKEMDAPVSQVIAGVAALS